MQIQKTITHTLLEAQDLRAIANFREAPAVKRREAPAPGRAPLHDLLVPCLRPDLMADGIPPLPSVVR